MWNKLPPRSCQQRLREAFGRWGLPGGLRLDNGIPWGNWNDLPTALALWLAGLGLSLTFNPPRVPQDNGVVEKSNDTAQRWCEPGTAESAVQLQQRCDRFDRIQREQYPSLLGKSRLAVFPQLLVPRRPYRATDEEGLWSLQRAEQYLASFVAQRQVSAQGQISVYARNCSVGAKHRFHTALLYYDPGSHEWVAAQADGRTLRRFAAIEITRERICALQVSARSLD